MYLPKSKYTGNLYSNGTLGYATSLSPYFGYYFKTTDNQFFTGNYPGDGPNLPLQEISFKEEDEADLDTPSPLNEYIIINSDPYYQSTSTLVEIPFPYYASPTTQDYQIGEFQRYFAKKVNENLYFETRFRFTTNSLYIGIQVPWLLTGDKDKVYQTNENMVMLREQQLQISGLGAYLNFNYLKFYK